jgi:hypothetical protein
MGRAIGSGAPSRTSRPGAARDAHPLTTARAAKLALLVCAGFARRDGFRAHGRPARCRGPAAYHARISRTTGSGSTDGDHWRCSRQLDDGRATRHPFSPWDVPRDQFVTAPRRWPRATGELDPCAWGAGARLAGMWPPPARHARRRRAQQGGAAALRNGRWTRAGTRRRHPAAARGVRRRRRARGAPDGDRARRITSRTTGCG